MRKTILGEEMVFKRIRSSPKKYEYNKGKKCKVFCCTNVAKAKGFCMKCYTKEKKDYEINKSKSNWSI